MAARRWFVRGYHCCPQRAPAQPHLWYYLCPRNGTLLDAKGLGADVSTVTLVCCPATCRSCFQQARKACQGGDEHWSAERCCGGDIVASRLYCNVTTQPPCIIGLVLAMGRRHLLTRPICLRCC